MTEADAELPETTETALSLSQERLSAKSGKSTQEAPVAKAEPSAQAQAADEDADATQADTASPAADKPDFSFVADPAFRAALENPNPKVLHDRLKALMGDYTQKSQKASEYEKKAAAFDDLISVPGAQEAIANLLAGAGRPSNPEPEEIPDLSNMDSKEIIAYFDKRIEAKAEALAERKIAERVQQPVARVQGILNVARGMYAEWQDRVPEAVYKATWDEAVKAFGEDAFTPENTPILFTPYLKAAAARIELEAIKGAKAKSAEVAKRATSPAGTSGSPSRPAVDKPIAKGDKGAIRSATAREVLERYGWSERDLDAAAKR